MANTVNPNQRSATQFFEDLSDVNFNKKFSIFPLMTNSSSRKVQAVVAGYYVVEAPKFSMFNLIFNDESNKIKLSEDLVKMVKFHLKQVSNLPTVHLDIVAHNLTKIGADTAHNITNPAKLQIIQNRFNDAIQLIRKEGLEKNLASLLTKRPNLDRKNAIGAQKFYKELSNTGWFGKFRPFNQRFHIITPSDKNGGFEIYLTPKGWKCFRKPTSFAEKLADAKNLAKMVCTHSDFIRDGRLNTAGMIENLEIIKKKMTRNINPTGKTELEKHLDVAINSLKQDQKVIDIAKSEEWLIVGCSKAAKAGGNMLLNGLTVSSKYVYDKVKAHGPSLSKTTPLLKNAAGVTSNVLQAVTIGAVVGTVYTYRAASFICAKGVDIAFYPFKFLADQLDPNQA